MAHAYQNFGSDHNISPPQVVFGEVLSCSWWLAKSRLYLASARERIGATENGDTTLPAFRPPTKTLPQSTCLEVEEPVPFLVSSSNTPDMYQRDQHKGIYSLPNYSLRLQREGTQVAAVADHHWGERVEPNLELAVQLVAGSTTYILASVLLNRGCETLGQ